MKLSKLYPFIFGLFGFPIQVFIGNAFEFLYLKILFKEDNLKLKLAGTVCKFGDFHSAFLPYLLSAFSVLLLLFLIAFFTGNKYFRLFCASYFVFLSFALFVLPLPNNNELFYLRALFIASSYMQAISHYLLSNDVIFYLIPLIFSFLLLRRMDLQKQELVSFLLGSLMSLLGSFSFFYGISLLH